MTGIREYKLSFKQFCGIKHVGIYGKTCPRLSELERILCACVEIDLEDAGNYFSHRPLGQEGSTSVIFPDWERKIPALEHAAREKRSDEISSEFEIGIVPAESDFPEFSEAIVAKHPSGSIYYTWSAR